MSHPFESPKMAPGQVPYTERELTALYSLVSDAADEDPGEEHEPLVAGALVVAVDLFCSACAHIGAHSLTDLGAPGIGFFCQGCGRATILGEPA